MSITEVIGRSALPRCRPGQLWFAEPGDVVGECRHGIALLRRVAGAVTAQVDDEDAVTFREVLRVGREAVAGAKARVRSLEFGYLRRGYARAT